MDYFVAFYGRYWAAGSYANDEMCIGSVVVRSHQEILAQSLEDPALHPHSKRNIVNQIFL